MHVMFDLETFGTKPGSVLRSIGAVTFDPFSDEIGKDTFYANIDRKSCEEAGLKVDPGTERWWSQQSKESQEALLVRPETLRLAVAQFHDWFLKNKGVQVWCQGANFDSVLWEAAATAVNMRVPWKFWDVRDTRTAYDVMGFDAKTVHREGTYHNALDDSVHQARCVQQALARLRTPVVSVAVDPYS